MDKKVFGLKQESLAKIQHPRYRKIRPITEQCIGTSYATIFQRVVGNKRYCDTKC